MENLTAQQIFDRVATHLLTQGRRSLRYKPGSSLPDGCAYRGADGLKCAIGCLIPDEVYDPRMEGRKVHDLVYRWSRMRFPPPILSHMRSNIALLGELQRTHDISQPGEWPRLLRDIASRFGLSPSAIGKDPL